VYRRLSNLTVVDAGQVTVQCPVCGSESTQASKEWTYGIFHVKYMSCGTCHKTFQAYFKQGKLNHTVYGDRIRSSTLNYLKMHKGATLDEISKALNVNLEDVLNMLLKLEKQGAISSSTDQ
jgi:uncharacterized Zn finger protein